jgi:adenylate kinase family enzyme
MQRIALIGNSGSGKSTLATRLARRGERAHLDLDVLAWDPGVRPPRRRVLADSRKDIAGFMDANDAWVIEGCYADLIEAVLPRCTQLVFLHPGVEACQANALARPWEPHKYDTKEEQDAGLEFLLGWIRDYATRTDTFSLSAHRGLFDAFAGSKVELTSREAIAGFEQ